MVITKQIFAGKHGELKLSLTTVDKDGFAHSRVSDRHKAINQVLTDAQDAIKVVLKSETEPVPLHAWKDAVLDAAIVDWIFTEEHERNPRKAVNDLLVWAGKIALDPAVSKEAADMQRTIVLANSHMTALRVLAQELVARYLKDEGCGFCGGLPHSTECLVGRIVVLFGQMDADRLLTTGEVQSAL
jgi:hypothetical protein